MPVKENGKDIGYLGFKLPREYYDAYRMYRILYSNKILDAYGIDDLNSSFLYLFTEFCKKEGGELDVCLKMISDYESKRFRVKKELRDIDRKMTEIEAR